MRLMFTAASRVSLAASLFVAGADAARNRLKPGLWEITSTMDMPGMPVPIPPRTHTQCITAKDADDPKKFAPESSGKDQECSLKDYKATGDKVTWSVECQGKRPGRGTGEMVRVWMHAERGRQLSVVSQRAWPIRSRRREKTED